MFRPKPKRLRWIQATRKPFINPAASAATSWKVRMSTSQLESCHAIFAATKLKDEQQLLQAELKSAEPRQWLEFASNLAINSRQFS